MYRLGGIDRLKPYFSHNAGFSGDYARNHCIADKRGVTYLFFETNCASKTRQLKLEKFVEKFFQFPVVNRSYVFMQ